MEPYSGDDEDDKDGEDEDGEDEDDHDGGDDDESLMTMMIGALPYQA